MRRPLLTALLTASLLAAPAAAHAAEAAAFTDVAADYWGADAIRWAAAQHIVDGYEDGTFKPDQPVGQKEFLAMLVRAYHPADFIEDKTSADWAQSYIDYAYRLNWGKSLITQPPGPAAASSGDVRYTRTYVARIITNASGRNYNTEDSIRYMLDSGLSAGKTAKTVEGYGANDQLTRAEAVTFIRSLKQKLDALYEAPSREEPYKPDTIRLSPAENWKLAVRAASDTPEIAYSEITLDQPAQGYITTSDATYTVSGTVQRPFGDGLTFRIDKLVKNYGFTVISKVDAPFKDGKFAAELPFSSGEGLYRISVDSAVDVHHHVGTARIAMFYVKVTR